MKRSTRWWLALCGIGLGALGVHAQTTRSAAVQARSNGDAGTVSAAPRAEARWQESLEAFALADQAQAPQPGGVLFVGSSSIRLWSGLETQFAGETIV
ncbi:MAG: GDSL family lipase, partial [Rhizobacter sp.]